MLSKRGAGVTRLRCGLQYVGLGGVRRTDPKHDLGGLFILDERGFILKRGVIL